MKDFLGTPVEVGDLVAATAVSYVSLHVWVVIKVTPQTVLLERTERWKDSGGAERSSTRTVRRTASEFMLVSKAKR